MRLTRTLQTLGFALVGLVFLPEVSAWCQGGEGRHGWPWVIAFGAFLAAYTAGVRASPGPTGRRLALAALFGQAGAAVGMAVTAPCLFGSLTLVVLAWQVGAQLPARLAAVWLVLQAGLTAMFVIGDGGTRDLLFTWAELLGLQAGAAVLAAVAAREQAARAALARSNAELRGTRALLQEQSRAEERLRIARELHDGLGHGLTALGLQLEVARHLDGARAAPHLARGREMADRLLEELRLVVGDLRKGDGDDPGGGAGVDLGAALRLLCADTPGLTVHLDLPARLVIDGAARAHCVFRCVQEVVTNTLRHALANNLWLRVTRDAGGGLTVEARDDGRGAAAVRPGHGLRGMRERLEALGGWLRLPGEQAGGGATFAVTAWLPGDEVRS